MKAGQLHSVLQAAGSMHRDIGDPAAAQALEDICALFDGRETMTVQAFAALIDQVAAAEFRPPATSGILGQIGSLFGKS
jgi:hypothetical protein